MTLKQEGESWILETQKFPVSARVFLSPVLKSIKEKPWYNVMMVADVLLACILMLIV
jgi:hypothetical protein